MEPRRTWTIVQFVTDGTVEAVPTNWLEGDRCNWPPLDKTKLRNAIRKTETSQTTWKQFEVKIFKNSCFDDYAKARSKAKAKAAENTSDLQSEIDQAGIQKKRKIVLPSWTRSSDDEWSSDETILPSLPSQENKTNIVTVIKQEDCDEDFASQSLLANRSDTERRQETGEPGTLETLMQQNHLLRALVTEVLEEVQKTRQEVQQVKQELQQMKQNMTTSAASEGYRGTSFLTWFPELIFPLKTEQEMNFLEMKLEDKEIFDAAVEEIRKVGGSSSYNFCRRALSTLITDELALCYSWFGRRGKTPFKDYRTASIVTLAAEKAKILGDRKIYERSVQMWLRRATDRLKTRISPKKF